MRTDGTAPDALPTRHPGPSSAALQEERAVAVRRAVAGLPEHQRTVLMLREFGGLSYRDIAEQLGLPRGTVESRVMRARERLRTALGSYVIDPDEVRGGTVR